MVVGNKELKFLTKKQIANNTPSVFCEKPSPEVSKKYTHIPTSTVIEDMEKLGWGVVESKEMNTRTKGKVGFQKHMVVFRNPDVIINGEDGDTVYPQILLTNSHDGKTPFKFTAGLFRLICGNGLVIATETFEDVNIRHMGYSFEELQVEIKDVVERLPLTVESMNKMKKITLSEKDKVELAIKTLSTRFDKDQIKSLNVDYKSLLEPVRKEDEGDDLWTVFNVLQEKIIEGDFEYMNGVKIRKARQIKSFSKDIEINRELFQIVEEMVN